MAAILAADIAGYSTLMGADDEATVRDLKAHQAVVLPMVSEHGGLEDVRRFLARALPLDSYGEECDDDQQTDGRQRDRDP